MGNGADFANGNRDLVGGESHRLGVEVAARDDAHVGKNKRIVGDGIRFDFKRAPGHAQKIEAGAIDLRLAADAIGILHPLVAFKMAFPDDGAGEQTTQGRCRIDLPLWPRSV